MLFRSSPHDGAIATVQIELNGECWVVHWDKSLVMQDVEGADLFRAYLESPKVTKIIHNASFELMFFYEAFGPTLKCRPIHDTMAGEYILSEGSGFDEDSPKFTSSILGLGAVVFRMYGVEMDKDKAIRTSFRRKGNVQVIPPARQGTGVCGHDGCLAPCDVLVGGDELPLCGFHAEDPSYKRYKKRQAVSASEFVEHRVTHTKLTARQLNYAAFDALWCGVLAPDQIEAMAMKDIMEGEKFTDLFTMDCKATEVIARMQWKGIPVNVTALMCLDAEFQFEEEELRPVCVEQVLDRSRALVAAGRRQRDRGLRHVVAKLVAQARRGRLLDHLLVSALQRAVALEEVDRPAVPEPEDLDLDVTRLRHVALQVHRAVAKGLRGEV